jgi:hypothetical protein
MKTRQEAATPMSEQPKFTPGLLTASGNGVYKGVDCVAITFDPGKRDVRVAYANARLFAAAPALYEALRLHMQWIGPPPIDRESFDSLREDAWRKGREALALVDALQETK